MILKYFIPEKDFDWDALDKITAKQKGLWTWPMAGLCWLHDYGFEIISVEDFSYDLFSVRKEEYLVEKYGQELVDEQAKHSDINEGVRWAKKFSEKIPFEERLPSVDDLRNYLDKGYLLIINVNARSMNNREGYVGHNVVVKGYDDKGFMIHDPGGPPRESVHVETEQFNKGWEYPDKNARNLVAIRL